MTVGELILSLQKLQSDADVVVSTGGEFGVVADNAARIIVVDGKVAIVSDSFVSTVRNIHERGVQ